jgi:hypothetical protein
MAKNCAKETNKQHLIPKEFTKISEPTQNNISQKQLTHIDFLRSISMLNHHRRWKLGRYKQMLLVWFLVNDITS